MPWVDVLSTYKGCKAEQSHSLTRERDEQKLDKTYSPAGRPSGETTAYFPMTHF